MLCRCSHRSQPAPAALEKRAGIPAMNKSRKLCSEEKSLPNSRWQYASVRQREVHPWVVAKVAEEGCTFFKQSSSHHMEKLQRQNCRAQHVSFVHVPKISQLCGCVYKRSHQSKVKCSAKISFFFPNKPRTWSNSKGTSIAFFFTSLSKSYKGKNRRYWQNSVQAFHPGWYHCSL